MRLNTKSLCPAMAATLIAASLIGGAVKAEVRCEASDAELLAALKEVADKQRLVGVQAAIYRGDRLAYSVAFGFADREQRLPMTAETRIPMASITKAFTGLAALKAVEAGKFDLDAEIQRYVPDFPVKSGLTITPRRLAAHRAGIRHWGPERGSLYGRHFDSLEETVLLFRDDPLLADAGLTYQYSSYGYNLLGWALENATGKKFTSYVEDSVLGPLGLTEIKFDDVRQPWPNMAKLYSFYDLTTYAEISEDVLVPDRDYSHNMAGGNMSGTAGALARLGSALHEPGFLSAASYQTLTTRPEFEGGSSAMSTGFFLNRAGEEKGLNISGSNPGVQAALAVRPERRVSVAVLTNTWGAGSRSGEFVVNLPARLAMLCVPLPRDVAT